VPVHAALTTEMSSAKAREYDEAVLLGLIQAFVERAGGVRDLLERGAALRERIRPYRKPLDRILRTIGAGARGEAFRALLGKIAQRAFDGRPVLLLLSREFESGMQCRNARVAKRSDVLRTWSPARREIVVAGTLLRVSKRSAGDRKRSQAGENSLPHGIPPMAFLMPLIVERRAVFSS
jgi:hypothetical protein